MHVYICAVGHHAPRYGYPVYIWWDECCGGISGLRRLLGTFGYEGACARGKTSCIAVASQRRLTSER